jgi:hypothetical protein
MSGSKGGGSTNNTTQVIMPGWVDAAAQSNLEFANKVAEIPYQANPYARAAPMNADQLASYQAIRDLQGSSQGAFGEGMDAARGLLGGATPLTADRINADTQSLLNPYSNIVIDPSLELMRQELDRGLNATRANASGVGAFGGSRLGVEEGIARSQEALKAGQLKGQLLTQGYEAAAGRAMDIGKTNLAAGEWAATTLPQLAATSSRERAREAGLLEGAGRALQGQQQAELNLLGEQWQQQYEWPWMQLQTREHALQATPYGTTQISTGTGPTQSKNMLGSIGGGALSGAAMGAPFGPWGAAIGAIGGGLLGAFS